MQIAQKLIDREHPVRDTPLSVTLPFMARYLKCCLCCFCCLPEHVRKANPDEWEYDPLQTALDVQRMAEELDADDEAEEKHD